MILVTKILFKTSEFLPIPFPKTEWERARNLQSRCCNA